MPPSAPILYALVDYYNLEILRPGITPTYRDHEDAIDYAVSKLAELCESLQPRPLEIQVRLYGGWLSASTGATTVDRDCIGAISRRSYPTRRPGRPRILVQPADALFALPDEHLPDTIRHSG